MIYHYTAVVYDHGVRYCYTITRDGISEEMLLGMELLKRCYCNYNILFVYCNVMVI